MADSTLTIKIVSQTGGNPPAKPSAPQAQAPGNAPAGSVQVAPRSSSTTSSATKQQAQAERSLATLAIGMFANQGFNTLTDALGTIPGQSRNAKRLSNIGGGAIAGATAGAMLGPAGMAVGAAIGTAAGALKTLADEAKETRDALRSLKDSAKMTGYTTGAKRQDAAFVRSLQWMTRDQRDEAITERANQIKRGDGDTSVRSLTNAIEAMAKRGLTDTPEYKEKQNLLAMQKSRLATLGDLDDKNYFQNLPTLLKGSEHTDALQKIGGQIGSTINVKDSDREMINLLREISTSTRILATNAPDSQRALDASSGLGVFLP